MVLLKFGKEVFMKNSFLVLVVVLGIVFGFSSIALAGRPLSTDDAGTVEPGHLEVELGWEYANQPNDDTENSIAIALTTGVVWDRLDFGIEIPYLFLNPDDGADEDGFGDMEARLKLRFLDETDSFPAMATTVGIKTTTGDKDKGLGSGEIDVPINLIATKGFDRLTLHANLGYNIIGEPEGEDVSNTVGYGVAGEFAVTEIFCVVGEVVGEIQTEDTDSDNPAEILIGATYELPFGTVLDGGVGFGLTDGSPDYKITAGLTHEF